MPSDTNITVTGRHIEVTDAIRDFATKKIEAIHIDYPKIVEARVVVDVQKERQMATRLAALVHTYFPSSLFQPSGIAYIYKKVPVTKLSPLMK